MVAKREEELDLLMRRLEKCFDRKRLTLNAEKSKVMVFKKGGGGGGRERKWEWKWKGKQIETVKEFVYLGVRFQSSGKWVKHVREGVKKAQVLMRLVWGIGERMLRDDFKKRMFMFDRLIVGVLLYGAEMFGWIECQEMEAVQVKYIKWCRGLERSTPSYMVLDEVKRDKMWIGTGNVSEKRKAGE